MDLLSNGDNDNDDGCGDETATLDSNRINDDGMAATAVESNEDNDDDLDDDDDDDDGDDGNDNEDNEMVHEMDNGNELKSILPSNTTNKAIKNEHDNDDHQEEEEDFDDEDLDSEFGLSDCDKNKDGTVSDIGFQKLGTETWADYPWDCCTCGMRMISATALQAHHYAEHEYELMRYLCVDCSKTFSAYDPFVRHVRQLHRAHLKYW